MGQHVHGAAGQGRDQGTVRSRQTRGQSRSAVPGEDDHKVGRGVHGGAHRRGDLMRGGVGDAHPDAVAGDYGFQGFGRTCAHAAGGGVHHRLHAPYDNACRFARR